MELEFLPLLLFLILIFSTTLMFFYLNHHRASPSDSTSLYLKPYPIIGNLPYIIKIVHQMLEWSTKQLLASPTGTVVVSPFVFTIDPINVEHMTKTYFHNFPKVEIFSSSLHDFLGHGILNVNGDDWKQQRKTASYEFNTKSLRSFILDKVKNEIDNRLVPFLREASQTGRAINLQDVLERFAFDNICSLLFAYHPDCLYGRGEEGEQFFRAFDEAIHLSVQRVPFLKIWKVKKLLNLGSEKRLKESMTMVHKLIEGFINSRKKDQLGNNNDFLSRFVGDGSYSDEFIRDILISFLLAGRDTTPSALTWFFWLLSSRPHIVEKILKEVKSIRARHNSIEKFTLDEIKEMNFLHATISETMRLYPPISLLPRECMEDDLLPNGTKLKKGWIVTYNAYAMARSEKIWGKDCEEFKPERWLDEEKGFMAKNMYEYPVFHAGPRVCLGKDMAYIQMKLVAASILEGFEMEVVEERGRHQLGMTLRMEGDLPVRVKERNKAIDA